MVVGGSGNCRRGINLVMIEKMNLGVITVS